MSCPNETLRDYLRTASDARRGEVAAICGCSAEHLRHVGAGRKNASVKLAQLIHRAVGVGAPCDLLSPQTREAIESIAA